MCRAVEAYRADGAIELLSGGAGRCAQFLMDGDNCGGTWVKEHRVQAVKSFHFGSLKDIGILKRRTHISQSQCLQYPTKKIQKIIDPVKL